MKKIAIVTPGGLPMPPVKGGAVETLIQFLVENNEVEKLAEITVFSCDDEKAREEAGKFSNTEFVYIKHNIALRKRMSVVNQMIRKIFPGTTVQFYPFLSGVIREMKKKEYDCILMENWPDYVPMLCKKTKLPIILHMHNDYFNSSSYLAKKILGCVKSVIAVSEYVKKCVQTIDEESSNISVLKNVIQVRKFSDVSDETRNKLRKDYGIKDDEFVFAFVGRLIPGKGVKELIVAFRKLSEEIPNARLLLIGAQWFGENSKSEFTEEIKVLSESLKDKILFSGYVDYSEIQNQYACADGIVVPSIVEDAAPMVVLESMASGKPLIVSDSGGICEYADETCSFVAKRGKGFTEELYHKMKALISDRELSERMGKIGKEKAKVFDKENYLKHLLKLIGD